MKELKSYACRKNIGSVPEFTSVRDERVKILVNSRIRIMDRISKMLCAARPQDEWRHAVSKFRRGISRKIAVEKRTL